MAVSIKNAAIIATLLKETPKPVFLLGAGASVTAGIPLAGEVVSKAAKWAYARENGKNSDDPRITRSDWYPWLEQTQNWFRKDVPLADLFPYAVENLLKPQKARKEFWVKILNPDVRPSIGYLRLVELMHLGKIDTVLTTNFDECINKARNEINRPAMIDYVRTSPEYVKITATPGFPVSVFLHGDVNNYSDKNVIDEIKRMDDDLVEALVPLLKDHPLIVVGYRGAEPSVMEHLLLDNAKRANQYKNGIYWCLRPGERPEDASDYVKALVGEVGNNFEFVEIESFDSLFDKVIWSHIEEEKVKIDYDRSIPFNNRPQPVLTNFDLKNAKINEDADLDQTLLRIRIPKYCERLNIDVPTRIDDSWLVSQLLLLNLLRKGTDGNIYTTNAGLLLFSKVPQKQIQSAKTIIRFSGPKDWLCKTLSDDSINEDFMEYEVSGNLWDQLNAINDALIMVNRPFRLKESESVDVTPYDPIALKEVIVNSLVHRDYELDAPNLIEVRPSMISIKNPGGLTEEVRHFFEDEGMIEEIRRGRRGIKGYRNPVLADLFYGAGAMDKRGSGLFDVVERVRQNGGRVDFEPNLANTDFTVVLECRPEAVDEITRTAIPFTVVTTKYSSNILEFKRLPELVTFADTSYRSRNAIFSDYPGIFFPPFELYEKELYTLTNLNIGYNTLRNLVDVKSINSISIDEYLGGSEGEKRFVRLLNDSLKSHFHRVGLIVDIQKKRAYFPKKEDGERIIAYQARFKKAKRTVARPRFSANKEKIKYWEHKAFHYSIRNFADVWAVIIEPTYVFTLNGEKDLLASTRVGSLATKKMSRDYNASVLNDLTFWLRMLSIGETDHFTLRSSNTDGLGDNIVLAADFSGAQMNNFENYESEEYEVDEEQDDSDIDSELAHLAEKQRQGIVEDIDEWNDEV
ncbi:SIR2 family protein [Dyadobacter sp. CY343]|uniref:SIR2 family protein n=1 Tax=Dyadobacter sp. CY343 TaxID=2907299 RepID=UPI001F2068ED|nr:SIR2 family protein [Dyadobacter sp. CY343]MCE7061942.1 SIR2 family protein [Dyadobacter sp. CY343]